MSKTPSTAAAVFLALIAFHLSKMSACLSTAKIADFVAKPFVRAALSDPFQPGSVLSFFLVRSAHDVS